MRLKTKPSTAKCNEHMYSAYLMSAQTKTSCVRLSEIMYGVSHDSINRFLERERFTPLDLFNENRFHLVLSGGVLSVDDSVLDKQFSNPEHAPLIDYYWSGKHHKAIKGLNLVTLFYTDTNGLSMPVNYRICNKSSAKTKNDLFREMLDEVLAWGLRPAIVTGDSWYSSLGNLKHIRKCGLDFLFGVSLDRQISIIKGSYIRVDQLVDLPDAGQIVYLKEFGSIRVFRQNFKEEYRYYIMGVAKLENLDKLNCQMFEHYHAMHWNIENYHRAIKQVCNIEKFQVRKSHAIRNHVYCSLRAFCKLELMKSKQIISNLYQLQRELFNKLIAQFIQTNGVAGIATAYF